MQIVSSGYQRVLAIRNALFDHGFLPIYRSRKPVISVGNIAFGGTGKTSLVELIAREVDRPVAILERGYKARTRHRGPVLVTSPDEGDEAFLLQKKLPFAKVIVGRNRVESAKLAETLNVDYILMDDGMQHRYLHRDLELVVVHEEQGPLRESATSLARADYLFYHGNHVPEGMIGLSYTILNPEEIGGEVAAYCGIGKPALFFAMLEQHATIRYRKTLPDHGYIKDLSFARGLKVVCTEKDAVKQEGVVPMRVAFKITAGQETFNVLCNRIRTLCKNASVVRCP